MRRVILPLALVMFALTALVTFAAVVIPRTQTCRPALVYNTIDPYTYDSPSYLLDTDSRRQYPLPTNAHAFLQSATGHMAFTILADAQYHLYLWKPYDSWQRLLSNPNNITYAEVIHNQAWSHDGRLAYVGDHQGHTDMFIYTVNADLDRILELPGVEKYPHWSYDGRLAFISFGQTNYGVMVMTADGEIYTPGEQHQFLTSSATAWSNEGRLAFKVQLDNWRNGLYMLQPDGTTGVLLNDLSVETLVWSPVAERLLLKATPLGEDFTGFYVVEADGTLVKLPLHATGVVDAWWTDDGRIAFLPRADSNNSNTVRHYSILEPDGSVSWGAELRSDTGWVVSADGRAAKPTVNSRGAQVMSIREADGLEWAWGQHINPYISPQWIGCPV